MPPLFEADKVTSYEVGVKSQRLGGEVQWNNAAFFMTWENLQVAAQCNFQPPITGWDAFFRVEGSYKGSSWTQLRPTAGTNRYQDSFNLIQCTAGIS